MLATRESHRGKGLAKSLVSKAIDLMTIKNADEIALETEESNTAAMKLYESLGFLRSKKLHRYYLNGSSAYRLLLYLKPGVASIPVDQFFDPYGYHDLPPSAQDDSKQHGQHGLDGSTEELIWVCNMEMNSNCSWQSTRCWKGVMGSISWSRLWQVWFDVVCDANELFDYRMLSPQEFKWSLRLFRTQITCQQSVSTRSCLEMW